jgi:hypothetical protein
MSIEFQEDNFGNRNFGNGSLQAGKSGSQMVDFLIKNGIVKDAATANILLVLFALGTLALSIYFFVYGFSLPQGTPAPAPTQAPTTQQLES